MEGKKEAPGRGNGKGRKTKTHKVKNTPASRVESTKKVAGSGIPLTREEARGPAFEILAALGDAGVKPVPQLLYFHLRSMLAATGEVYFSLDSLARRLSSSEQTVRRGLDSLKKQGLVKVDKRDGKSSVYHPCQIGTPAKLEGVPICDPCQNEGDTPSKMEVDPCQNGSRILNLKIQGKGTSLEKADCQPPDGPREKKEKGKEKHPPVEEGGGEKRTPTPQANPYARPLTSRQAMIRALWKQLVDKDKIEYFLEKIGSPHLKMEHLLEEPPNSKVLQAIRILSDVVHQREVVAVELGLGGPRPAPTIFV